MNRGFWLVCECCVIANAGAADGVVGPGNCDEAGFASVLAAVEGSGGGTVTFDCGDDATFAFTSYKTIQNAVTIDGANRITFDGGEASAFFDIPAGASLTLQHMIVQHGAFAGVHALENRGHLRLFDVRVILNTSTESPVFNYGRMDVLASTFGGNSSDGAGGAITNSNDTPGGAGNGGVLVVGFSSFEANASSATGGAIYNYFAATTLWGVTLNGNTATAGGAVDAFGSTVVAMNSTFADNHATSDAGGAIRVQETGLRVDNTNLVDNTAATNGGGISCEVEPTGFSSLYATTFAGNTAGGDGGGAYVDCDLTYADVTFNANAADGSGGAIAAVGANNVSSIDFATIDANTAHAGGGLWSDGAGAIAIGHSIVSANTGGNCEGTVTSSGYNLSDDAGCAAAFTATGDVLDAALPLMELGDYGGPSLTQPPASDSAAVDHIPVDACAPNPRWDERSALRPVGDACDSGAVELGGVVDFILINSFESG